MRGICHPASLWNASGSHAHFIFVCGVCFWFVLCFVLFVSLEGNQPCLCKLDALGRTPPSTNLLPFTPYWPSAIQGPWRQASCRVVFVRKGAHIRSLGAWRSGLCHDMLYQPRAGRIQALPTVVEQNIELCLSVCPVCLFVCLSVCLCLCLHVCLTFLICSFFFCSSLVIAISSHGY